MAGGNEMARILATGIATLDIVNIVHSYPGRDDEVRALSQRQTRGGNASNTLVVLSQLGHDCHWAGVLIDEPDAAIIRADLAAYDIDCSGCLQLSHGKMPTSYITLSQDDGSRSIVHYRDCPELDFDSFARLDPAAYDWLHFEGRHVAELDRMLRHCAEKAPDVPVSLEVEKPRDGIESLFGLADVLMFSRPYAQSRSHDSAESLLGALDLHPHVFASCTWGEAGAWARAGDSLFQSPAFPPLQVVDTLGAGDTFNAGLIDALLRRLSPSQALDAACRLAGKKCGRAGFNLS